MQAPDAPLPNDAPATEATHLLNHERRQEQERYEYLVIRSDLHRLAAIFYLITLTMSCFNEENLKRGIHDAQIQPSNPYSWLTIGFVLCSVAICTKATLLIDTGEDLFAGGLRKIRRATDSKSKFYGWGWASLGFVLSAGSVVANYFAYILISKYAYMIAYSIAAEYRFSTSEPPIPLSGEHTVNIFKGIAVGGSAALSGFGLFKTYYDHRANRNAENHNVSAVHPEPRAQRFSI